MPSADSTPLAAGTRTDRIPSSSATSQACSGPAPPKAISSNPRGSCPRSTDTTLIARTISWFATATIPAAAARTLANPSATVATARRAAFGVQPHAARKRHGRVEPAQHQVRVRHRRWALPPRP